METNTNTNNKMLVDLKVKFSALKNEVLKNKMILVAIVVVLLGGVLYFVKGFFVAALVNGVPVSRMEVVSQLEKANGKAALDSLVTRALVQQEANKKGVKISADEVNKEVASISDNLKSQNQNLDNVLQAQGMTRAELNEQIKYQKTVEQLLGDKVAVTDAEVNTYMTDNKASLPTDNPDQVKSIVKQQLAQQKLSSEYQTYVTELKAKAKVTYFVNY